MKTEQQIRQTARRLHAQAYAQQNLTNNEALAITLWTARNFLLWVLDEYELDWTPYEIDAMDRMATAIEQQKNHETN